jgi:hypothetical protein
MRPPPHRIKSPAGFRARRREMHWIVFSDDRRVRKSTLRAANVRFVRALRANRAMSEAKPFQKSGKTAFLTAPDGGRIARRPSHYHI